MNDESLIIVSTVLIVAAVVIVCYIVDHHIKEYLKKYTEARDSMETATVAKVVSNATTAFEEALKKSFNDAIADGVITKAEALKIVTDTFTAVKDEFIKTSKELINEESLEKESAAEDDDE